MNNPRLATRYAKSIIDLAIEMKQLDAVYTDMKWIVDITKSNPDFVSLLRSPIINSGTKGKIIDAITGKSVGEITLGFIRLLVRKSRETNLPEIAAAFIHQYNIINDIHKVKITTAVALTESMKEEILHRVERKSPKQTLQLETVVNEAIIGGFLLEIDGSLLDASILRDLKEVKKQFSNNDYLHKLR